MSRAPLRLAGLALLAGAALAAAGGARQDDPVPPPGAYRSDAPRLLAPGEVVEPIRDRTED
ncbi:MAG: hypothetical protein VX463_06875 [Pseudomonadota bacterium]|nr:hypothetical protein [Pseudomonadota bacterium]